MRYFILLCSLCMLIAPASSHAQNDYTHYGSIDPHAATSGLPFFDRGKVILQSGNNLFISNGYVNLEGRRSDHLIKVNLDNMNVVGVIPIEGLQGDNAVVDGCVSPGGGLVFTGEWRDYGIGKMRPFLAKYNTDLELQWINYFFELDSAGIGYYPKDVCSTSDGGFFVYYAETREAGNPKTENAWVLKTDEYGERLFHKMIPDTFSSSRVWGNITPTEDGHYFLSGYARGNWYHSQAYKIDEDAEIIWYKAGVQGQMFDEQPPRSTRLPGGGGVLAWMHDTIIPEVYPQLGRQFNMLFAYDDQGNLAWRHGWYDRNIVTSAVYDLSPAANGDLLGVGYITLRRYPSPYFGPWVFRMDSQGHQRWERFYNDTLVRSWPPGHMLSHKIIELNDGRLAITGIIVDSTDHPDLPLGYQANVLLLVLDSMGCLVPGCEEGEQMITAVREPLVVAQYPVSRLAVSPNPASDRIEVALAQGFAPSYQDMVLECHDMNGRQVHRGRWNPASIDVKDWPPGSYALTLRAGYMPVAVGRVVIVR